VGFCSAAACGSRIGLGVPAASMFCEHLADADDAALMRLNKYEMAGQAGHDDMPNWQGRHP